MNHYAGLDIGSTYTKVVITRDTEIIAKEVLKTGVGFNETMEGVILSTCEGAGIARGDIRRIGVTGYGRKNCAVADFSATEIRAIARAVHFVDSGMETVLDIGGQDFKIIHLNNDGSVVDFFINDKCASGTGRFMELISLRLNLTLDEMSGLDLSDARDLGLSSTCAVFADAEVIKLISEQKKLDDIVYSVYTTVRRRISSSDRAMTGRIALTGGVSKNGSFVSVLKRFYPDLCLCDISPVAGAYGMALLAYEAEKK